MNQFVNPKKRSVSLPGGCKDLVDVLRRSERTQDKAVRRFIHVLLLQALRDNATDLVIGTNTTSEVTPLRYKVEGTWYDMAPFPSNIRPDIVTELARMAKLVGEQFPSEGIVEVTFEGQRFKWVVSMANADAECVLIRA